MRRVALVILLGSLVLLAVPSASGYRTMNLSWPYGVARFHANTWDWWPADIDMLTSACETWSEVPGSSFRYHLVPEDFDWAIFEKNGQNDIYWYPLGPGVLGVTFQWVLSNPHFIEVDIAIDTLVWLGYVDLETVALHELGHALGLDHEDAVPSIMNTFWQGIRRDLFPDDEQGIRAIYPAGPPPPADGVDVSVGLVTHSSALAEGIDVDVNWRIENLGNTASGDFHAVALLDGEPFPSASSGTELGRTPIGSLDPGSRHEGSLPVSIPASLLPGKYYLGIRARDVSRDVEPRNDAAAPARALEITRPPVLIGPGDRCAGSLGPYGADGYLIDLPKGATAKAKASVKGQSVRAKLGLLPPSTWRPTVFDIGKKPGLDHDVVETGRYELRIENDRAFPARCKKLLVKVSVPPLRGVAQPGHDVMFWGYAGGDVKVRRLEWTSPWTDQPEELLVLLDPDGDPVPFLDRLKIKTWQKGGAVGERWVRIRKVKLKLKDLPKTGEYTIRLGKSTHGTVDHEITVTMPKGRRIDRDDN